MLAHISISNYTIVDQLEMEFSSGMTVITGETGAGKSIMLDALGLCLGDRADPKTVRSGCDKADISATFDISTQPAAQRWLAERELASDSECILRRVVTREGRSRAFINGKACTLQDCSQLGELLIDIHSQHAHQSLLRREVQRDLLDNYAGKIDAARKLEQLASDWLRKQRELDERSGARDEQGARAQLLSYQVDELDQLALQGGELAELEQQQKQLANAEQILQAAQQALELSEQQEQGTRAALQLLQADTLTGKAMDDARELLDSAAIQIGEAHSELQRYLDGIEIDPARLAAVEQRLDSVFEIARKHRVRAEDLAGKNAELAHELAGLQGGDQRIEELQAELDSLRAAYNKAAKQLSTARAKAATKLTKAVEKQLTELAMQQCRFIPALTPRSGDNPHPHGLEDIELLISTNPGQEPQSLGKIASGGELSRISLAIQVVTSATGTVPSMVFDEVDVGIGGAVAEVVGRLLRAMAQSSQVLCITHLPQVASQGHQHLRVAKTSDDAQSLTTLSSLDAEDKVEEIARMLGGIKVTEQTRAHAREMLEGAEL